MKLHDIISFMESETVYWGSCSYEDIIPKFDVLPNEYREFMEEDLKGKDKRNYINALSNGKRSLDCQIESLLYAFCLKDFTDNKRYSIPRKIELLQKIGIIAPRILQKINSIRNTMEHEFYCPNESEVQDFADVILLFNSYTDKYLHEVKYVLEIMDDENENKGFTPVFDREKQKIVFILGHEKIEDEYKKITFEIKLDNENYDLFIKYLQLHLNLISTY